MPRARRKGPQVVSVPETELECTKCGDVLFSKEEGPSPSKVDAYLWLTSEVLVCDSCGFEITAGALADSKS